MNRPLWLMGLGVFLLAGGFAVIFAMVIRVVAPSFFLSFAGYAVSFAGLLFGLVGVAQLRERGRW